MAAVRDPATGSAPPPVLQGEVRSSAREAEVARATAGLYRRYGATVYRYAWHMLGSREDAEDATQATFLSVHAALGGDTAVREPQAWVLRIARNECLARIEARMRRPLTASLDDPFAAEVPAPAPSVPRTAELRSDLAAAGDALGRLPTAQREAYVLREWLGMSTAEVALALGTSVSAVDALLNRARSELIRVLGGAEAAGAAGCTRTREAIADDTIDRATRAHLVRCRSCRAVRRALRPQLVVARSLIPSAALAERLGDAMPGFALSGGNGAAAGSAVAGSGGLAAVVAKLATAPAALKGAAAAAATVAAVGGGVALESAAVDGSQSARADERVATSAPVLVAAAPAAAAKPTVRVQAAATSSALASVAGTERAAPAKGSGKSAGTRSGGSAAAGDGKASGSGKTGSGHRIGGATDTSGRGGSGSGSGESGHHGDGSKGQSGKGGGDDGDGHRSGSSGSGKGEGEGDRTHARDLADGDSSGKGSSGSGKSGGDEADDGDSSGKGKDGGDDDADDAPDPTG